MLRQLKVTKDDMMMSGGKYYDNNNNRNNSSRTRQHHQQQQQQQYEVHHQKYEGKDILIYYLKSIIHFYDDGLMFLSFCYCSSKISSKYMFYAHSTKH